MLDYSRQPRRQQTRPLADVIANADQVLPRIEQLAPAWLEPETMAP